MKSVFNFVFAGSIALGELMVWIGLWGQSSWFLLLMSILVPVILLACILTAEFILVILGYEGSSHFTGPSYKESIRGIAGCFLFAAVVIAGVPFLGRYMAAKIPSPVLEMSVTEAKASLQKSIADWTSKQEKIALTAAKFDEDRQSLASRIRSMGFSSTADIGKTPSHRKIAEEYAELQSQIATLRKRESGYKTAIEEVRSSLRRLDRQEALETAGISTVELEQLARTVAETDERLENSSKSGEKSPVEIEIWLKEALTPGSN